MGPLTAYAEYAPGEVAGDSTAGRAAAIGGVYNNGPFSVGASYTARKINPARPFPDVLATAVPTATSLQDNKLWMIGGGYSIGAARVTAGYSDEKQDWATAAGGSVRAKNAWAGVSYTVTPAWEVTGAYYQTKGDYNQVTGADGQRGVYIVGATYAMSKRTNLYFEADYNKLKAAAISNGIDKQVGVSSGINHVF